MFLSQYILNTVTSDSYSVWPTRLRAVLTRVRIQHRVSPSERIQTDTGAHPASSFLHEDKAAGVSITTHLHLIPRLRMSGVVPLLPIRAFLACTARKRLDICSGVARVLTDIRYVADSSCAGYSPYPGWHFQ